ncbi:MAG: M43 family zinc metalloprotease, partial [Pseudomonadota bacterium]
GAPSPHYTIRIHAIRTANDDGTEETAITPDQVRQWVQKTNAVLGAASAGITLEFDARSSGPDWGGLVKNTTLNHMGNGDATGTAEANKVAAKYPGKLVFFIRYAAGSGATQNRGNGFASASTDFVALPAFDRTSVMSNIDGSGKITATEQSAQNIWQMAHDFGHYLGLGHTFPGDSDGQTDTLAKAAQYIRDNGGAREALDGDGIADTPAEAGASYFAKQGWPLCSGHDSYTVTGTKTNGQVFSYTYSPARNNIMSYFACEPMGFTAGQVRAMRAVLASTRKHLIEQACFADFHGMPASGFQRCFDYWTGRGLWPVTLSTYAADGSTYMAGSFQSGADRPVYAMITRQDFYQKFETFRVRGFRPDQMSVISTSNGPRFTVVWAPIDGAFQSWVGMTRDQYQAKWEQMRAAGLVHVDLVVYHDGGLRFGGVWVKRPSADYLTRLSLSSAEYTALFERLFPQGYRPTRFAAYQDGGVRRYAVIMEKLPGQWAHWRDMTAGEYQGKYNTFAAQGLRLYHLSVGDRFSAIWHKP